MSVHIMNIRINLAPDLNCKSTLWSTLIMKMAKDYTMYNLHHPYLDIESYLKKPIPIMFCETIRWLHYIVSLSIIIILKVRFLVWNSPKKFHQNMRNKNPTCVYIILINRTRGGIFWQICRDIVCVSNIVTLYISSVVIYRHKREFCWTRHENGVG